jgi:signal transduction histidine kinase
VATRIFQRSFTTKAEPGHGLGTYSMRLLAERYLDGQVVFESTPEKGTTFSLMLPST